MPCRKGENEDIFKNTNFYLKHFKTSFYLLLPLAKMFYLCSFASTVFKLISVVESNYIYPKYFDEISCMILRFYNHIMYHPFFARIVSEFTNFNHETLWKFPVRAPNLPVSKIYFCIFVLEISGWFFFNMKIVKSNQTARLEKILNSWFDSGVISKFIFCQCPIPFKSR